VRQQVGAAKWTGLWLLQIPLFLITSYLARTLIGLAYRLLIRAGANLPINLLLEHFLWVSFGGGLLAGLIGLQLLRVGLLILPGDNEPVTNIPWNRPQAWTWVLPTCWLIFGIIAWLGSHTSHSVLASSAGAGSMGLLSAFFGSGCSLSGMYITAIQQCMPQLTFSHPWLGSVGYSAATLVPVEWLHRVRKRPTSGQTPGDPIHQEHVAR